MESVGELPLLPQQFCHQSSLSHQEVNNSGRGKPMWQFIATVSTCSQFTSCFIANFTEDAEHIGYWLGQCSHNPAAKQTDRDRVISKVNASVSHLHDAGMN
jgi:hypothetical protein